MKATFKRKNKMNFGKPCFFVSTQNEGESKIIDEQNCKKKTTKYCKKKNHKNEQQTKEHKTHPKQTNKKSKND